MDVVQELNWSNSMENLVWPPEVGVLIPAYQAAAYLDETLQAVMAKVPKDRILVVDDGSNDATSQIARQCQIEVKRHAVNLGKGAALATGLTLMHRKGIAWTITMDADGQHSPKDLPQFLNKTQESKVGIVVGTRPIGGSSMPWHRRFSNRVTTFWVSFLAGKPVFDAQSGYRMYRNQLMEQNVFPMQGRFEWEAQALILARRAGWEIASVPIATLYGEHGSHMRLFVDTLRFIRMMGVRAWMR